MLALATAHGDTGSLAKLESFCERYWQPVHLVIRSRVTSVEQAHDLTQAFFVCLMEKSTLRRADKARGRFRTFLLTVLWRFLRDERERNSAEKRGGHLQGHTLEDVERTMPMRIAMALPIGWNGF